MGKMKKFHFRLIMTVIERNRMCIKYILGKKILIKYGMVLPNLKWDKRKQSFYSITNLSERIF
jgi:hypothetical protein